MLGAPMETFRVRVGHDKLKFMEILFQSQTIQKNYGKNEGFLMFIL